MLVVLAVFIVGLLFAGWFLNPGADNVARLYISFVMTSTSFLMMLLGLFLSCFSLPNDIKNKTIQTITTKPVRPTEIIFGRILGFTAVGTLVLGVMGGLSYEFVRRGIRHQHERKDVAADGLSGTTNYEALHAHTFEMLKDENGNLIADADGNFQGVTDEQKGHMHVVTAREVNGELQYTIGPPEGLLEARIPIYAKTMAITDRDGSLKETGLNVGYESTYHTYIEGAGLMSAIWTFEDLTPERFRGGDVLPIELSLQAFRTFKGDIVTGVQGEIILRNPDKPIESKRLGFIVKEFAVDYMEIPRTINGTENGKPRELDIFDDLVSGGRMEIIVRCSDSGQYLGVSTTDLYLRAGDSTFGWNLFKGYFGIWMQMVLVICLGVMFSTFLSGPVAMVATLTCLVLGFFGNMALDISTGQMAGGGPLESLIRMPLQTGAEVDLDLGNQPLENSIKFIDKWVMLGMWSVFQAVPSFGQFNTSDFVAHGYDIFGSLVLRHIVMTFGYFVMTSIVAYFFLKTRELAAA
ncbi:MAG: ABC transporter permease [Pirellulaceae bacterium]